VDSRNSNCIRRVIGLVSKASEINGSKCWSHPLFGNLERGENGMSLNANG
jgi:hypothetical protein